MIQPATPLYVRLIGDGAFTPEQLLGYEFGYRTSVVKNVIVSFVSFHNRYDDLLSVESAPTFVESTPAPSHLVLPLYLRNGLRATTSGMEIVAIRDLSEWWRVRGSYSFLGLDARRKPGSNDASTVNQLENDSPAHKAVLQSMFNFGKQLELDLTWRYVSAIPNQRVPSYSTGDVRLERRLGKYFALALVGQNLLQPSHFEYGGDPGGLVGIKRSVYLKATWSK